MGNSKLYGANCSGFKPQYSLDESVRLVVGAIKECEILQSQIDDLKKKLEEIKEEVTEPCKALQFYSFFNEKGTLNLDRNRDARLLYQGDLVTVYRTEDPKFRGDIEAFEISPLTHIDKPQGLSNDYS